MIYDVFTYNGEKEMLDLHLNILDEHVDKFIIVEAKTTFSGNKKPLYFSEHERFFKRFHNKITYHIIDENYSQKEIALAESSPNTKGASHWKNEFLQKESIHKALKESRIKSDDTVYIGDVDEIWRPYRKAGYTPAKLKLLVYAYYLNNLSNEVFYGPVVSRYAGVRDDCLNHLRSNINLKSGSTYFGWHFTSMGGEEEVRRKLNDSYTNESYNTPSVQDQLHERVKNGTDYLGRPFTFRLNESHWPQYLLANREKYAYLCK